MKPIQIFVRHCYKSPNAAIPGRQRPEWFSKEACWENLKRTANHEIADITVCYDAHFGPMNPKHYVGERINVGNFGTEASSFLAMLDIVKMRNFPPHTIIYFVEDDYLHRLGWCEALLQAFTLPIHYATLYDHSDKYLPGYDGLASHIFARSICHWRTTPSTTNTYACKAMTLAEDWDFHERYSISHNNGVTNDCAKFEHLERMGRVLISPIPGFSTHCDQLLSPTIDWEKISNYTTYG